MPCCWPRRRSTDFASADLLRTVVESCPTKLLLANPALDRTHYAELFRLNDVELDLLTDLIARRQTAAQTSGCRQGAQPECGSSVMLALYQHAGGQRTCDRDVSGIRFRGGPRPPGRLGLMEVTSCVSHPRHHTRARPCGRRLTGRAETGIREVTASERSLIPLHAKLRYTTMILLPDEEEILDVVCGDKDFWVISATQNIAHVKPAKEGAATNLNLVTASGAVYSFLLTENKSGQPDLEDLCAGRRDDAAGQAEMRVGHATDRASERVERRARRDPKRAA